MVVIDGIVVKGRRIVIPALYNKEHLQKLHIIHMGIQKIRLLTRELTCLVCINTDIESAINRCSTYFEFQFTHLKDKPMPYDTPNNLWETVHADELS